jgi:hypothetical protein
MLISTALAQSVGDYIINEKTSSSGRVTPRYWPKGVSKLWGTDGSSLPQSITIGSGLSLTTGTLTASGGSLSALSDVTLSSPALNQVLRYNGTAWVNYTLGSLATQSSLALTSLEQGGATSGQAITWNGTNWAPTTIGGGITIGTTTSNGTAGNVLYTDGTNVQTYATSGTGDVVRNASPTITGATFNKTGSTALFYCPTATTGETRTTFRAGPANSGVPFNPMFEVLNNAGSSLICMSTLGFHTDQPIYIDSAVSGYGATRIQANSIKNVNLVSNTTTGAYTNGDGSIDSCVNLLGGVLTATTGDGQGSISSFHSWAPTSGSVPFIGMAEQSTLNQTGSSTGVSRSFWARSFMTKTYAHRSFENAAGMTNNLRSSPSSTQSNWLANYWTYAAASAETITHASTINVTGPPIAGTNITQTSAYGIRVQSVNVGAGTTAAFGIHVSAPTGATTNHAAKFDGRVNFTNLQTTSSGLSSGDIWNDSGTIKIVP